MSTVKNREVFDMAVSKGNALGIVALIGAILMIVGVFITWVDVEVVILGNGSYTGWQVYTDDTFADADYYYAPLVALIAGIVAFFTAVLPIVLKNATANRILGIVSLILGIVALILMVLFYGTLNDLVIFGYKVGSVSAGTGLWMSLAGSVLLILGAILDIAGKYNTE